MSLFEFSVITANIFGAQKFRTFRGTFTLVYTVEIKTALILPEQLSLTHCVSCSASQGGTCL